jgi:hypothetical protein
MTASFTVIREWQTVIFRIARLASAPERVNGVRTISSVFALLIEQLADVQIA